MTDFSRYLIATDLDGTFFGPYAKLVERNLAALERFKAGGGLFTFNTGRQHYNIEHVIPNLPQLLNAPAALCNGAYLYDFEKKRAFDEAYIGEAEARELVLLAHREFPDLWLRVPASECVFVECADGRCSGALRGYRGKNINRAPSETWRYDDWFKLSLHGKQARVDEAREVIERIFGDRLYVTTSGSGYIDVQSPDANKAKGNERLRRYCGEERILICCGDFENDLEMLEAADISVCPSNALNCVKRVADYTMCHHSEGLIADIIEHIERGELLERKK